MMFGGLRWGFPCLRGFFALGRLSLVVAGAERGWLVLGGAVAGGGGGLGLSG